MVTTKKQIKNEYGSITDTESLSELEQLDKFVYMVGQRDVKTVNVAKISKAMIERKFADFSIRIFDKPTADGKYEIADGQHRLAAWKDAKIKGADVMPLTILYISTPPTLKEKISLVQSLNKGAAWLSIDRFKSCAEIDELYGYKEVLDFCHTVGGYMMNGRVENIRYAGAVLLDGDYSKQTKATKGDQNLLLPEHFTKDEYKNAKELLRQIVEVSKAIGLQQTLAAGIWFESLARAWRQFAYSDEKTSKAFKAIGFDKFLTKMALADKKEINISFSKDHNNTRKIDEAVKLFTAFVN